MTSRLRGNSNPITIGMARCSFRPLFHDPDTNHAGKGCEEMREFHMMFLTSLGIKARTIAHVGISLLSASSEPGKHEAVCFPSPDDAPRWEMCDFRTGMGSCYNSARMIIIQNFHGLAGIRIFSSGCELTGW